MAHGTSAGVNRNLIAFASYTIDDILEPLETFLGFYAVSEATGSNLVKCVKDVFLRCNLSLEKLRGQSYDGASIMSEAYNGCRHHCREQSL